jgi:2-dehydropantoate 2-reductase
MGGGILKIAIIGAGAMGMLFGGYLSRNNYVVLIDTDKARVDEINKNGISIREPGGSRLQAHARAACSPEGLGEMELAMLWVKAMDSRSALEACRRLAGPTTFLMSLQNGSGHDAVLKEFAAEEQIIVGTTQHNSSIVEPGVISHGGAGKTFIGPIAGDRNRLKPIEQTMNRCGIETEISENIRRRIWEKLFLNASASALTAILQTRLGFLLESRPAALLIGRLVREAVAVANAEGMGFEEESIQRDIRTLVENAREGYPSIYADIHDGRKTEVDAISGYVVAAGKRNNVPVPSHEFVVELIHALEDKGIS